MASACSFDENAPTAKERDSKVEKQKEDIIYNTGTYGGVHTSGAPNPSGINSVPGGAVGGSPIGGAVGGTGLR